MATVHTITFGALLRQYRAATGLTQEELAERAKLSVRAVSDLERGVRQAPHKDTLALLIEALGLSEEESSSLWGAVRQGRRPSPATPSTAPSDPLLTGLPSSLTPLIGREREEAAIAHLLAHADMRLLTLTGPAGIGKTRLAQQVALDLRHAFAAGVVFVPLVPIREPALVLLAIAQALGVREEASQSLLAQLQTAFAERELLLVLDNFEHVVGAAAAVAALLAAAPRVKALVTSRTTLHVRGEQEFAVPPLDTPDLDHLPALEDLAQYAAVALFVRRAQAVRPAFTLTPELAPTVVAICVRLDGLPLAIELAAARLKVLSPQALLARLDSSLLLLTRGAVDLPKRQQTMRSAIAWSYDLLAEPERRMFRRLAVFVGGWTLEAAEAVCDGHDGDDGGGQGPTVLDRLTALVDESLVVPGEGGGGEPRFRLLELIREYGLERLAAAGEESAVRQRHADYYVALAEAAEPHLHGDDQAVWFACLSQEHGNLRAALRWAKENGAIEQGLHLATTLWGFWYVRGHLREGRTWLESFLALQREPRSETEMTLRAEALRAVSNLALTQGDYDAAVKLIEESLILYRSLADAPGQANALNTLGVIANERGEYNVAVSFFEESLALFRQLDDTNRIAMLLGNLATVAHRTEQYARAIDLYEKSLELHRQTGNKRFIALIVGNLGDTVRAHGDLPRAAKLLEESLALHEELGDKECIAERLNALGELAHQQDDLERSAKLYRDGIARAREGGAKRRILSFLDDAADLACDLGLVKEATRLFSLSTTMREQAQMPRIVGSQARYESRLAAVRAALGGLAFGAEWEIGRRMTLDEAEALVATLAGEGGAR